MKGEKQGQNIEYLSDDQIHSNAESFRRNYCGNNVPIDIELIAERELGLILKPVDNLKKLTDIDAFLSGNLEEIGYDPSAKENQLRFSIAHEIGHFMMHRSQIIDMRASSYSNWKKTIRQFPNEIWGRAEYQANEFAGRLLVPRDVLISSIIQLKKFIKHAEPTLGYDVPSLNYYLSIVLARQFNVPDDTMIIRFFKEKIDPFKIVKEYEESLVRIV